MSAKGKKSDAARSDVAESSGGAVAVVEQGGLPAYLRDYTGPVGTENIDSDDISIPRVEVGQDMHKLVQEGGIERGDLFLNLTGEKLAGLGEKMEFALLAQNKEFILWRPRKDNGGERILARARKVIVNGEAKYAWDKPNQSFDVKVEGKIGVTWKTGKYIEDDGLGSWGSEIPGDKLSGIAATAHHNYIIYLPSKGLIAALSLTRTKAKKAKDFNAQLKMGRAPIWARLFTIETVEDSKDGDAFFNIAIKPAGFVPEGDAKLMESMFKDFQTKNFAVDHSDGAAGNETDERE